MSRFLELMKQSAIDAYDSSKPMAIIYGTVISASPLKIQVDQKLILPEEFLILTNSTRDYSVSIDVDFTTQSASGGSGEASFASHGHKIQGATTVTVHNRLKTGDVVIMARAQGGQKYIVLDKGGDH